jgi:hypothetical protein
MYPWAEPCAPENRFRRNSLLVQHHGNVRGSANSQQRVRRWCGTASEKTMRKIAVFLKHRRFLGAVAPYGYANTESSSSAGPPVSLKQSTSSIVRRFRSRCSGSRVKVWTSIPRSGRLRAAIPWRRKIGATLTRLPGFAFSRSTQRGWRTSAASPAQPDHRS